MEAKIGGVVVGLGPDGTVAWKVERVYVVGEEVLDGGNVPARSVPVEEKNHRLALEILGKIVLEVDCNVEKPFLCDTAGVGGPWKNAQWVPLPCLLSLSPQIFQIPWLDGDNFFS